MEKRIHQLKQVQKEGLDLFIQKNTDYGDAFASHGVPGILVRLGDKLRRFQTISKTNIQLVKQEKIRDTLIDIHNYAAMGVLLLDEKTPKSITISPVTLPKAKSAPNLYLGC